MFALRPQWQGFSGYRCKPLVLALLVLLLGLGEARVADAADPSLVAAYSFDEGSGTVAHDSVANHEGTLKNGAEWTGAGKFGSAIHFDGVNDLVTVTNTSDLEFVKNFTLEAWVRPEKAKKWSSVLTKETPTYLGYQLHAQGEKEAPAAYVAKDAESSYAINGSGLLPLNKWSHLALTSDGSTLRLYVNGSQVASVPSGTVYTASGALHIGGNVRWGEEDAFQGVIDEVRIYKRTLTGSEIAADKETGIGWDPANRLVAAYSFDEGSGTVAHDSIGSHDGLLKNGTVWSEEGKFASAVRFDGVDDLITVPAAADLNLSKNFTLEAWVKPDALTPYDSVLTKEAGVSKTYSLIPEGDHVAPKAEVAKTESSMNTINATSQLPLNAWSHLALTFNGEHLRLYVNGTQVASVPQTTIYTAEGATQLGGNLVDSEYFDGFVDEIRIYNRTLSATEIAADKETGIGWDPANRLVAAYSFDEGSGTVAHDSVASHDGAFKNGTTWSGAGKYGSAVRFDGIDDLITVPAASDLNLSKNFTLEGWVKPDALTPYDTFLTKEAGSSKTYSLIPEGDHVAPKAEVAKTESSMNTINAASQLPLNTWSHLALTFNGAHLRLYVNGTQVASVPQTTIYTAEGPTQIGGNLIHGEHFKGFVDELRIYNRTLSQNEIRDDRSNPIGAASEEEGPPAINTSNFADVWCITSSSCFAVGDSDASGSDQWQIKRWTVGIPGWTTQQLAAPTGAALSKLNGVSCSSASLCLAVGDYEDDQVGDRFALAAEWDGQDWQRLGVPKPEGAKETVLSGVFCNSGGTCVAVGGYTDSSGVQKALAMIWNGFKWTIANVPTPAGGTVPKLSEVACATATECRAAGSYVNSSSQLKSLVAAWNGSAWSAETPAGPAGATSTSLSGIDCVTTMCVAVGTYTDSGGVQQPLALHRSGGIWSVGATPKPGAALSAELRAVSCATSTTCTAVGAYKSDRKTLPLVLGYANSTWWIHSVESADYGAVAVELNGASCNSTGNDCHLVGSITYGHGSPRREFSYYRSESTWVADKPEPLNRPWIRVAVGRVTSRLADVSCPTSSLSACVSVGTAESGQENATKQQLGSVGTGTSPSLQTAAPGPSGAVSSSLLGVACTSTSSCWAVGNFHNATEGGRKNFGTRWNGISWTPASLPAPGGAVGAFSEAVSCGSASDCVAVGGWKNSEGDEKPLAVRWNGTSWSQINPSAPAGALDATLTDVSCASATKCAAVGGYVDPEGLPRLLAYSWNGTTWSQITTPAPAGRYAMEFTAVSCTTGSCYAFGDYVDSSGRPVSFATKPATPESMSAWSVVAAPIPAEARFAEIQGIDCTSASRCLAAGRIDKGSGRDPWTLSWNGSTWSTNPASFDTAKGAPRPLAVDCVSSSSCGLVGYASPATGAHRENLFAQLSWPAPGEEIGVVEAVGAPSTGSMRAASCAQLGGYTCIGVGSISGPLVKHSYSSSISSWSQGEVGWKEIAQPTGIANAGGSPTITDVDCYSASACTAVGGSSASPQISRWNGTAWSQQTASAPAESTLQAIEGASCPATSSCVAVGYFVKAGVQHPVAYRWKGEAWSTEVLDQLNLSNKRLKGVSCISASSCVAVGYSALTSAAVIYEWNGTAWASKTVPAIPGSSSSELTGVSCTASDQCTAVGSYKATADSKEHGLVLRWNGTAWIQQDDSEAAETKSYSAVSCYSRVGCVATAAAYGQDPAVVLAWNGSEWSREEARVASSGASPAISFKDVSCASAFDCVVVGEVTGAAETKSVLALEPQPGYADGEFGSGWEEEAEGEAAMASFAFDEGQEDQITDLIARDPVIRQKLGGAAYSLEIGPWSVEPEGTEVLAGAVAMLTLEEPRNWPKFELWPVPSFFPVHEPKDFGQGLLEFKALKVREVLVTLAANADAEGNIVDGEVIGFEPQASGEAEYIFGPKVEFDEERAGVND
jgi:hypothetical protein